MKFESALPNEESSEEIRKPELATFKEINVRVTKQILWVPSIGTIDIFDSESTIEGEIEILTGVTNKNEPITIIMERNPFEGKIPISVTLSGENIYETRPLN